MAESATSTKPHVAVLMGGWSSEREVSLVSGAGVAKALTEAGYKVTAIDVQRDLSGLLRALASKPDVIFNALHGRGGEDGCVQGVLEFLGIPYTHSGVLSSALCMDKPMTKKIVALAGVPVAPEVIATREDVQSRDVMPVPYVIKPLNEGSSVGVRIVGEGSDYQSLSDDSWIYGAEVMVEQYIPGRELTVGVLGDEALGVTEIIPAAGFYDYTAKYAQGGSRHVVPADVPDEIAAAVKAYALTAHKVLGCQGCSRSDFRWDSSKPGTSGLIFLEINTQPGMTPVSLLPEQAQLVGLSYGALCARLVAMALEAHAASVEAMGEKNPDQNGATACLV